MKNIDEIEKLGLEDLERIASDESIHVPDGLEGRLVSGTVRWSPSRIIAIAASLVIIAGLGLSLYDRYKPLEDTFDDPATAYAVVEETLWKMSGSLEVGMKSLEKGKDMLSRPSEVIKSINNE